MPALERLLHDYDLGLLRAIAELWGLELEAASQREAADQLAARLRRPELLREVVEALPPPARAALADVLAGGRMPLALFTRRHGELRAMGAARREREQPWRNDPSPAEALWYRGLIGRAFFDEGAAPQEFVYVADDLLPLLPRPAAAPPPPGHLLPPGELASAEGLAADDVTTLLAYLQVAPVRLDAGAFPPRHRESLARFLRLPEALDFFTHLVMRLGLAAGNPLRVEPAQARPFLEASRSRQVASLAPAWRDSPDWNDLRHVPGLAFEGQAWRNDPPSARAALLRLLAEVPPGQAWSLDAFVAALKERQPDFQRPAGDYDSWYIRDADTQAFLRGFENWERVDGALARWVIGQPLFWLGLADLSMHGPSAFRITHLGAAFLAGAEAWPEAGAPSAVLSVSADGIVRLPASASRYDRFQVARVSNWLPLEGDDYLYRLAPASLARAARQGIKVSHILGFLQKTAGAEGVPTALVGALHRWERSGSEASLRDTVVFRLKSRELLEALRRTPAVRSLLGADLGPEAVEVRREDVDRLRAALAELGILVD